MGTVGGQQVGENRCVPGELRLASEPVELAPGRRRATLQVANTGDRPVQVGSHFPFADANALLEFDRAGAAGMRLDIAPGTAVRFEPGEVRPVDLVAMGGEAAS